MLLLIAWVAAAVLPAAVADTVRLHPRAVVAGDVVTLGDVAELDGPRARALAGVTVGRIVTGGAVAVDLSSVRRVLGEHAVDASLFELKGSLRCDVRRGGAAATPPAAEPRVATVAAPNRVTPPTAEAGGEARTLADRVRTAIAAVAGAAADDASLEIAFRGGPETAGLLNAPAPRARVEIEVLSRTGTGRVPVRVRRFNADGVADQTTITADVTRTVEAAVVTAPVSRGDRLTTQNVTTQRVAVPAGTSPLAVGPDAAAAAFGQVAAASLRTGTVLTDRHVAAETLVQRGDLVTVTVRRGRLRIRTVARAAEPGGAGAVIALRNDESRERFYATVTGRRLAEIDGGSATFEAESAK